MKRLFAIIIIGIMLMSVVPFSAFADELPFEMKAPANVSLNWLEGNDSPTTCALSFSIDNDTLDFLTALSEAENGEEFLSQYGLSEFFMTSQIDWAIDDTEDEVSGWHYTKYWDYNPGFGFGYDKKGNIRTSDWDAIDCGVDLETVKNVWILRSVPDDERWNGNPDSKTPGVKDQLRPEQYEYHDDSVWIDFSEHTVYARVRFAYIGMKTGEDHFEALGYSDWSETAAYGKGIEKFEPLTAEDLPAPVISDLHMTDEMFNDNPVVAFTLTVPDDLAKKATEVAAHGGSIRVFTEARVKGDAEWTEMGNTDWEVKSGEMKCALLHLVNDERPTISADTEIELRCYYYCDQPELDAIRSEYSETITFGTSEINAGNTETIGATEPDTQQNAEKKDSCPICHFCPRPLGLCIFIWIAILVVIVVVVVIIIAKSKKKDEK